MKLGMRILSEVLNWTISILLAQPTKKASYRDFSKYQWSDFEGGYILITLKYWLDFCWGQGNLWAPVCQLDGQSVTLCFCVRTAITAPAHG